MDCIEINGLQLSARIGVEESERQQWQPVSADIRLALDLSAAARGDQLADTIDYASLAKRLGETAGAGSWQLLEALAGRLADLCMDDRRVATVWIKLSKPRLRPAIQASITICKSRADQKKEI